MPKNYRMYIDGKWVEAKKGGALGINNPATGKVFARMAYGSRADARTAIAAAGRAFDGWRRTNVYERSAWLKRVADLIRGRKKEISRALTMEVGKTLAESEGEVMTGAATFEWNAEEVKRYFGEWIPHNVDNKRLLTFRAPVGVCATISPWNFPFVLQARKIAPALAAGCTVVAKPASQTPLTGVKLFECLEDAGIPKGVANLVTGPPGELSREFMENPVVRKVSFTGSVEVGKQLMEMASGQLKRLSLELGGHSPFIICADFPVEDAALKAVLAKFRNMGQVCISPSRFYVPQKMFKKFTEEVVKRVKKLQIGNGLDPKTDVGPMFEPLGVAGTEALVEDIKKKGGKILCGGKKPRGARFKGGCFFEPTVAVGITKEMALMQDEPFAPILPIIPYRRIDDAIRMANDTRYGLASYVLTNDMRMVMRMADELEAGVISINDPAPAAPQAPFGGVKESGTGREGWRQGIDAYTEVKYLSIMI